MKYIINYSSLLEIVSLQNMQFHNPNEIHDLEMEALVHTGSNCHTLIQDALICLSKSSNNKQILCILWYCVMYHIMSTGRHMKLCICRYNIKFAVLPITIKRKI